MENMLISACLGQVMCRSRVFYMLTSDQLVQLLTCDPLIPPATNKWQKTNIWYTVFGRIFLMLWECPLPTFLSPLSRWRSDYIISHSQPLPSWKVYQHASLFCPVNISGGAIASSPKASPCRVEKSVQWTIETGLCSRRKFNSFLIFSHDGRPIRPLRLKFPVPSFDAAWRFGLHLVPGVNPLHKHQLVHYKILSILILLW